MPKKPKYPKPKKAKKEIPIGAYPWLFSIHQRLQSECHKPNFPKGGVSSNQEVENILPSNKNNEFKPGDKINGREIAKIEENYFTDTNGMSTLFRDVRINHIRYK